MCGDVFKQAKLFRDLMQIGDFTAAKEAIMDIHYDSLGRYINSYNRERIAKKMQTDWIHGRIMEQMIANSARRLWKLPPKPPVIKPEWEWQPL